MRPTRWVSTMARVLAGKSRMVPMMKLRKRPPVRFCQERARPYMMKAVVNQLKYMMRTCILKVECLMMSRKPPWLAAVLGLVRTICSGSTPIPFFLLATESTCWACSIFPLAMSHLGDSGSQNSMTEPTETMAEIAQRCQW